MSPFADSCVCSFTDFCHKFVIPILSSFATFVPDLVTYQTGLNVQLISALFQQVADIAGGIAEGDELVVSGFVNS